MIYKIEMLIPSYKVSIIGNKGIINNKEVPITEEDIDSIARDIRLWKPSYKGNHIVDTVHYIYLYDENDNKIGSFTFDGDYPDDFHNLVDTVRVLYDKS